MTTTPLKKPSAVILTAEGFQDEEYLYPYYRMLEAEFSVFTATVDGHEVKGKYGMLTRGSHIPFTGLNPHHFDLAVIPGGYEAPDRIRTKPEVKRFISLMHHDRKLLAAICHGPWVLVSAQVVRGKRITCIPYMSDDVVNAGALYEESPVVVDDDIITSPHYRNNPDFMREIIKWIHKRKK